MVLRSAARRSARCFDYDLSGHVLTQASLGALTRYTEEVRDQ